MASKDPWLIEKEKNEQLNLFDDGSGGCVKNTTRPDVDFTYGELGSIIFHLRMNNAEMIKLAEESKKLLDKLEKYRGVNVNK